jgi:hypothetical protein
VSSKSCGERKPRAEWRRRRLYQSSIKSKTAERARRCKMPVVPRTMLVTTITHLVFIVFLRSDGNHLLHGSSRHESAHSRKRVLGGLIWYAGGTHLPLLFRVGTQGEGRSSLVRSGPGQRYLRPPPRESGFPQSQSASAGDARQTVHPFAGHVRGRHYIFCKWWRGRGWSVHS